MSFLNSVLQGTSDALRDLFADSAMLPLTLLFLAVFIGILAVPRLVTTRSPVQRRLAPTGQVAPEPLVMVMLLVPNVSVKSSGKAISAEFIISLW